MARAKGSPHPLSSPKTLTSHIPGQIEAHASYDQSSILVIVEKMLHFDPASPARRQPYLVSLDGLSNNPFVFMKLAGLKVAIHHKTKRFPPRRYGQGTPFIGCPMFAAGDHGVTHPKPNPSLRPRTHPSK